VIPASTPRKVVGAAALALAVGIVVLVGKQLHGNFTPELTIVASRAGQKNSW
jgi:hypothetical protein